MRHQFGNDLSRGKSPLRHLVPSLQWIGHHFGIYWLGVPIRGKADPKTHCWSVSRRDWALFGEFLNNTYVEKGRCRVSLHLPF